MVEFSLVVPIRDETKLIPVTLPSYYDLNPSEIIFCLDYPPANEIVELIWLIARKFDALHKTRIIQVKKNPQYLFHQAFVRRSGFREAKNDIILTGDIDTIFHPDIKKYLGIIGQGNVMLVSFSKFPYPISFRSCIAWLIQKLRYHESFTGLYAFSKSAWLETEDIQSLKKIERGEDTHLHESLTKRHKAKFVAGIRNVVLRPQETQRYQHLMGWGRWKIRKTPLWTVLISTFLYVRPSLLAGYLRARFCDGGVL